MDKGHTKITYSISMTFITIFFLFVIVSIGLLNTYPTISSRDVVASTKQSALLSQVTAMSASLSPLEHLSQDGVEQVMALLDAGSYQRVVVTDPHDVILYDTDPRPPVKGEYCDIAEAARALNGEAVFYCKYDGTAFRCRTAVPVMSYGSVIGTVCILDDDSGQARLIHSIQTRLRNISLIVGAVTLLVIVFFSDRLARRLRELVKGMKIVREGDYDYRVAVRGGDEVAELADAFNEMTGKLGSTEELRRRFVSDASHELRTPLASIRLLSDSVVQSDNMDADTMREFVTDIGMEAERLQRMTEKLMKLTRMDSNVQSEKSPVNLKRLTGRVVHLLLPLAQQKNVRIYTELEDGVCILAAEDDLFQIIFNLVENAVKYNSFGGNVFLRLSAGTGLAVLTVEDTGIGIPEEDVPHIFSRFYRVDKARSREAGGSGLGLSIVHDAVAANGGQISVGRRDTVGTRFTVTFPLLKAGDTPKEEPEA
ncbi:MAG: HAMP domain-containing histidine kinase [Oscillospiraceae bacterium]|nr:HAMP domain-containing histidine kinase [Oscillospiraceae bacterium]